MNNEKTEQIKIALLGIIAVLLIIRTVNGISGSEKSNGNDQINPGQSLSNQPVGITVPANPINAIPSQITPQIQQQNTPPQPSQPTTEMVFDNTSGDLGDIKIGSGASYTYKVKNTGILPLQFSQVTADPGVTVVSSPKDPIPVGESGEIIVKVANEIEPGIFQKTIHVGSNTNPAHMHLLLNGVASK